MLVSLLPSILIILLVVLLFAAAVMIFRAMMYGRVPPAAQPEEDPAPVDAALVAERLATAVAVPTLSALTAEGLPEREVGPAFTEMHRTLERMYPRVHAALRPERVGGASLLYTWPGRNPELEPVMFCAHMDVVPADDSPEGGWTHPPFAGEIADGFVWGRGAQDNKHNMIAQLDAVEGLIRAGYQPERTLYLAYGHDEEIGGLQGARCVAETLEARGVTLTAVLDEGAAVMAGLLPGMRLPVALVGIAEKGYASVELTVEGRPGHSSMPPRHTAIGVLAAALARVEAAPMPARMSMANLMFDALGVFLPFPLRLALSNPLIFGGTVRKRLLAEPTTAALARTTQAVTMVRGGVKDNVLPAKASAVVNCRLLPGDTRAAVVEHIRRAAADEAVQVTLREEESWEASPVSPVDSPVYHGLADAIRSAFPEAVVAPYLVAGATDSRYYARICPNVYRFAPVLLDGELLKTIHGIDERIAVEELGRMVRFYTSLMKDWTS